MVMERTIIEKVVFRWKPGGGQEVLSRESIVVPPQRYRDHIPGESPEPTPPSYEERHQIGWWKQLREAVRKYGLDGDRDV